jgi:hypothetical protein
MQLLQYRRQSLLKGWKKCVQLAKARMNNLTIILRQRLYCIYSLAAICSLHKQLQQSFKKPKTQQESRPTVRDMVVRCWNFFDIYINEQLIAGANGST